jgi:hypothetical protein
MKEQKRYQAFPLLKHISSLPDLASFFLYTPLTIHMVKKLGSAQLRGYLVGACHRQRFQRRVGEGADEDLGTVDGRL